MRAEVAVRAASAASRSAPDSRARARRRRTCGTVPLAHFSALASSATTASSRPGSGSGVCVPPGNGGDQLMCDSSFGFARIADVVNRESAIAPRAVAAIAGGDHVMQRDALALGAASASRRPRGSCRAATSCETISGLVMFCRSTMHEDVVGEAVEVRRDVGVAPARPPQAVDAEAGHFEERDLAHLAGLGDVVDATGRSGISSGW